MFWLCLRYLTDAELHALHHTCSRLRHEVRLYAAHVKVIPYSELHAWTQYPVTRVVLNTSTLLYRGFSWPPTLQVVYSGTFNRTPSPTTFPSTLKKLVLGPTFQCRLLPGVLPATLTELFVPSTYHHTFGNNVLPPSLRTLSLSTQTNLHRILPPQLLVLTLWNALPLCTLHQLPKSVQRLHVTVLHGHVRVEEFPADLTDLHCVGDVSWSSHLLVDGSQPCRVSSNKLSLQGYRSETGARILY